MPHQIKSKIKENNDIIENNYIKKISSKNMSKEENSSNINSGKNVVDSNNTINKDKKINKNNMSPIKSHEKEKKEVPNHNNNYYNKKEQEVSMEEFHDSLNKKNKNNEQIVSNENKFKFNNISFPNTIKESKNSENENKQNKYSNYNMLLDSGLDIKNIPIYDSIEEIAEWPADLNPNANNGLIEDAAKMGDKLIKLESGNNYQKINKDNQNEFDNNLINDDFLELSTLFKKKDTLRPYTPPIEELVQVNPNKMKGDSNMKMSIDKKSNLMNTNRILKNYENLIYNQDKGLFYDPKTNKYYDIKSK